MATPTPGNTGSIPDVFKDLKGKHKLLSAACRCLEDERCYRFFDLLDRMSREPVEVKAHYMDDLATNGDYDEGEMQALRRLVMEDGAHAFKQLVDAVRDIRVSQEIAQLTA